MAADKRLLEPEFKLMARKILGDRDRIKPGQLSAERSSRAAFTG
ncbi:MAG: hypothetical protein AAB433_22210 [Nitrospirota bacterium]